MKEGDERESEREKEKKAKIEGERTKPYAYIER